MFDFEFWSEGEEVHLSKFGPKSTYTLEGFRIHVVYIFCRIYHIYNNLLGQINSGDSNAVPGINGDDQS